MPSPRETYVLSLKTVLLLAIDLLDAITIAGTAASMIGILTSIALHRRQQARPRHRTRSREQTKVDIGHGQVKITTAQAQISVDNSAITQRDRDPTPTDLGLLAELDALLSLHSYLEISQIKALRTSTAPV